MKRLLLAISLLPLLLNSCKKDDDSDNGPSGPNTPIQNVYQDVVPANFLDSLRACGFALQEGLNPPTDVLDRYLQGRNNVACTSLGDLGFDYIDDKSVISEFNSSSYRAEMECRGFGLVQTLVAEKAYFLGDEDDFTAYARVIIKNGQDSARFAYLISGTWDADSLICRNMENALMNIEIYSNPSIWMGEGDFRAFAAEDVLADDEWGFGFE